MVGKSSGDLSVGIRARRSEAVRTLHWCCSGAGGMWSGRRKVSTWCGRVGAEWEAHCSRETLGQRHIRVISIAL